ncbi:MAG: chemotaxis protein CheA [Vicinamibacteria bacterium]|nr:chemotaxis protein CheA [Vicinamibacteria bacterium]
MDLDLAEITEVFRIEVREGLAACEEALVALETQPGDREAVATVFRVVHTIKGNAASLGFSVAAELAHALEDLLHLMRDGRATASAERIDLLLRALDRLAASIPDAGEGAPQADGALLAELGAATRSASGAPAASPEGPAETVSRPAAREQTLRVGLSRLDRMLDLTGEVAIAQGRLRQALEEGVRARAREAHDEVERLCSELQELVMKARLVPLGPLFRRHARTVRDLAAAHGRLARLVVEGEDVEVDLSVVEHVRDPLTHMIRNAIDHGLETPAERRRRGKDPCGRLTLRARREASSIVIEVEDDGAGIDRADILSIARAKGLFGTDQQPDDDRLLALVFEPGFSTAKVVSDLSGRGVGLDVVRRNAELLRGTVSIASALGRGTVITLRLPLTLAIIPGLDVEVAGEVFVVPLDSVVECLDHAAVGGELAGERGLLRVRGECVPSLRLRRLFGGVECCDREQVVVTRLDGPRGTRVGLVVDRVVGENHAVVKPLGPLLRDVRWFSGCTILGDGRVAPILDVHSLVERAEGAAFAPHGARRNDGGLQ